MVNEIFIAKIEQLQIQKRIMATLNLKYLLKLVNGCNGQMTKTFLRLEIKSAFFVELWFCFSIWIIESSHQDNRETLKCNF